MKDSLLKVRYPKRAASRYMTNMARKDTLATPCIFLRERLFRRHGGERVSSRSLLFEAQNVEARERHSLFELLVHGQDGRVAHEGKDQDGQGVDRLERNANVTGDASTGFVLVLPMQAERKKSPYL